jgi:hypothetical protein
MQSVSHYFLAFSNLALTLFYLQTVFGDDTVLLNNQLIFAWNKQPSNSATLQGNLLLFPTSNMLLEP